MAAGDAGHARRAIVMMDVEEFATAIGRESGDMALAAFHARDKLCVETKDPLDFVTRIDRDVEAFLHHSIRKHYPEDGVLGEEGAREAAANGRTWVIDPIDGTLNFLRGNDAWAISVGVLENGRARLGVLYAPARGELMSGGCAVPTRLNGQCLTPAESSSGRDEIVGLGFGANTPVEEQLAAIRFIVEGGMTFRRLGASSVTLMMLMQRQIDAFLGVGVSAWDVAGGLAAAEGLALRCAVDWSATALTQPLRLACGSPSAMERLSGYLRRQATPSFSRSD